MTGSLVLLDSSSPCLCCMAPAETVCLWTHGGACACSESQMVFSDPGPGSSPQGLGSWGSGGNS